MGQTEGLETCKRINHYTWLTNTTDVEEGEQYTVRVQGKTVPVYVADVGETKAALSSPLDHAAIPAENSSTRTHSLKARLKRLCPR